jgi:asparagine synthetase B (glutamine-hydrolysing)
MCGILGASFSEGVIDPGRFADALDLLSHRGPDSTGSWFHDSKQDALGFINLLLVIAGNIRLYSMAKYIISLPSRNC